MLGLFETVLLPWLTLTNILNDRQPTRYAIALASYSVIYLGAGTLVARLLRRVMPGASSFHVLLILSLANLLLMVGAEVIHFLSREPLHTSQLYDVVNPFVTLRMIADAGLGSVDAIACLVVGAAVAIAANANALWRGVSDIVRDPVPRRPKASRTPPGLPIDGRECSD